MQASLNAKSTLVHNTEWNRKVHVSRGHMGPVWLGLKYIVSICAVYLKKVLWIKYLGILQLFIHTIIYLNINSYICIFTWHYNQVLYFAVQITVRILQYLFISVFLCASGYDYVCERVIEKVKEERRTERGAIRYTWLFGNIFQI